MMICTCGYESGVIDSRPRLGTVYRRRKCGNCGRRWTTHEVDVEVTNDVMRVLKVLEDMDTKIEKIMKRLPALLPARKRRVVRQGVRQPNIKSMIP